MLEEEFFSAPCACDATTVIADVDQVFVQI